ncbi:hypothetical protein GSF08_06955 [Clostridiaceae bacterium DONG20-135]|uniref:Uncharacterized protein n=1 Tax=Copranaerobaculum intestinale TaxID=2692629 RepID=A0A6N8UAB6_9FIRM|nr:hypothetical protein [Copranaerobaculum intestinale]MXQ73673.1 hypothetical protein [Copranaerobaculum intestinale]
MKKKLFISLVLFVSMIGITSVKALTNKDFGYANGIVHNFAKNTAYDSFQCVDSKATFNVKTSTNNRYQGSFSQNLATGYNFSPAYSTAGNTATVSNKMNRDQFNSHWHYGRSN